MVKWIVLLLAGVAGLVALFIASRTVMHTEIVINAPPEKVWEVLTAVDQYPEWNPVFVKVDGVLAEGAQVTNHVVEPGKDPVEMKSSVLAMVPAKELRQSGGIPGVITFDHKYTLQAEGAATRVIQHEIDQGLYMYFWDSAWVEPAYAQVNQALKERVEARVPAAQ